MPQDRYLDPSYRVLNFFDRSQAPEPGDRGFSALSMTIKSIDEKRKAVHAVMASDHEDRYGEVIEVAGFEPHLKTFMENPQLLYAHDNNINIGEWRNVQIKGRTLEGVAFFDDGDDFAMKIFNKYQRKFMRAFSVGFIGHQSVMETVGKGKKRRNRRRFVESELLECSAVTIPANPQALSKAFGVQVDENDFDQGDELPLSNRRLNKVLARSLPKALGGSVEELQRMIEESLEPDHCAPLGFLIERIVEKTSLQVANAFIDQLNKNSRRAKGAPLSHIRDFDLEEPIDENDWIFDHYNGGDESTHRDADDVDALLAR